MTQDQQAVAWMYEHNGCKNVYAYQLPDWSPAKGTETPLYATPKSSEGALLEAAEELVASLSLNDEDGLTEFAEPMVKMRQAIARAKAGKAQS